MQKANSPVGVFGGTFDPIHYGHLRIAEELTEAAGLACLHLIPTGLPPHRDVPQVAPQQRLQMARLATANHAGWLVDAREVERQGHCYTVDTLRELRAEYGPQRPLLLLVGSDAFLGLSSWHEWQSLWQLAHIVVAQRPGFAELDWLQQMPPALAQHYAARRRGQVADLAADAAGGVAGLPVTQLDISATAVREMCRKGLSPRYLLPDGVIDYIRDQQLYM